MSDPRGNNYDRRRALQTTPQLQGGNTGALANPPPVMTAPDTVAQQPTPQPGPMPAQPTMNPMEAIAMALGAADPRFEGVGQMAALGNRMRQQQYQMDMAERTARFNEEFKREELKLKRQQALTPTLRDYQYELEVGTIPRDEYGRPTVSLQEYDINRRRAGAATTTIAMGTNDIENEKTKFALADNRDFRQGSGLQATDAFNTDSGRLLDLMETKGFDPSSLQTKISQSFEGMPVIDAIISEYTDEDQDEGQQLVSKMAFQGFLDITQQATFGQLSEGEQRNLMASSKNRYRNRRSTKASQIATAKSRLNQLEIAKENAERVNDDRTVTEINRRIEQTKQTLGEWQAFDPDKMPEVEKPPIPGAGAVTQAPVTPGTTSAPGDEIEFPDEDDVDAETFGVTPQLPASLQNTINELLPTGGQPYGSPPNASSPDAGGYAPYSEDDTTMRY